MLFAREDAGRVSLQRVASVGGEPRKVVDDAVYGDFSPDGRRVAFVRVTSDEAGVTTTVGVAGADGGSPRALVTLPPGPFVGSAFVLPRWSPDGRYLAATQSTQQLGEPTTLVLMSDFLVGSADLSRPLPGGLAELKNVRVLAAKPPAGARGSGAANVQVTGVEPLRPVVLTGGSGESGRAPSRDRGAEHSDVPTRPPAKPSPASRPGPWGGLDPEHVDAERSRVAPRAVLDEVERLPAAEREVAARDRDRLRRAGHRAARVRRHVVGALGVVDEGRVAVGRLGGCGGSRFAAAGLAGGRPVAATVGPAIRPPVCCGAAG